MARRYVPILAAAAASAGLLSMFAFIGGATAAGPAKSPAATGIGSNWYAAAPYLMPLDNDPPDAGAVMDATGLKAFQLAFVLAPNGGGCSPTWDGTKPVSTDTAVAGVIAAIRAKGGDVSASVGGYGGTKLGQTCGTPEATAAAYQQVIDKYALKALDFDLEEPEYENSAAIHNEIGAAKILQQNNQGIYISVTTAGTADGTGWFGKQMLNEAKGQGFTPDNFSIMPFDGGFNGAAAQTSALTNFNSILQSTFGWDSATAYAHEGISQMNGRSDSGEYFYQADFQTVYDYATSHHMARFTNWSVNRDRQCTPPDNGGRTSGVCSSVAQGAWDFTKFSVRFAGATPPTSTPPTSTPPTSVPPSTCAGTPWDRAAVYTNGTTVSYKAHSWKAKWWTQGEEPGTTGQWGVWQDLGPC
ncbi:chitinase [Embleya sp. AB8]|uniref:chitinase n=1 Tax=Embleya sp. AB8 TaxID=3156304 RepID=UPI003C724DEA